MLSKATKQIIQDMGPKLSKAQIDVLQAIIDGFEIGISMAFDAHVLLQHGGIGRGGESRRVNLNTFHALKDKGLIEKAKVEFPTARYRITAAGRYALAQAARGS